MDGGHESSTGRADRRPQIAVVYHFFAHYRAGIIAEMHRSPAFEYVYIGDTKDFVASGIPAAQLPGSASFIRTRNIHVAGPVMWQTGLIRQALCGKFQQWILLGNVYWPATWCALLILRARRVPAHLWTHGWDSPDGPILGAVRRLFYRLATSLMLYGESAKSYGCAQGLPAESMHVIGNSMDMELIEESRRVLSRERVVQVQRQLFSGDLAPVAIVVSRLIPGRGLEKVFRALSDLRREGVRANLIVVGDGPERARLEALARTEGVSTHFEGACYDERRLAELFAIANVSVSPELVGLMAVKSLAHGVPVVTSGDWSTQGPEFEAIRDGVSGSLIDPTSEQELSAALKKWLTSCRPYDAPSLLPETWTPAGQIEAIERVLKATAQQCGAGGRLDRSPVTR